MVDNKCQILIITCTVCSLAQNYEEYWLASSESCSEVLLRWSEREETEVGEREGKAMASFNVQCVPAMYQVPDSQEQHLRLLQ